MLTIYTVIGLCGLLLFLAGALAYGCHCLMAERDKKRDHMRYTDDASSAHNLWPGETTSDWGLP